MIELLNSGLATERTIAVKLLNKYKNDYILDILINSLIKEKKLYTKITLSEEIAAYGKDASKKLIQYLGIIGENQHKKLPDKPFNKKNYPLPRDIIARTICKIGVPALEDLNNCLIKGSYEQCLEAVDAVGFISYYNNDITSFNNLTALLEKYENDNVVVWKIIRSFQAFNNDLSIEILNSYKKSNIKQHKWEAERSLRQLTK